MHPQMLQIYADEDLTTETRNARRRGLQTNRGDVMKERGRPDFVTA